MLRTKRYYFKKILSIAAWLLMIGGLVFLLVAAASKNAHNKISEINIQIKNGVQSDFIDEQEVMEIIKKAYPQPLKGRLVNDLSLVRLEKELQKDKWIQNAELFVDNRHVFQIIVEQKTPIARIIAMDGNSFYIDKNLECLPLSNRFAAKLPVFTGFPSVPGSFSKMDSAVLSEIRTLSQYISEHPFWMAQIDQIDITSDRQFELIPKLGNQIIQFGNADFYQEKFNNLLAFYKSVQTKLSWSKYSVINVQFKNQVVGVKRDAAEIKSDSLRVLEIMQKIIADAEQKSGDENQIQLEQVDRAPSINESIEREEMPESNENTIPVKLDSTNTKISEQKSQKLDSSKNVNGQNKQVPKTLMPPKKNILKK